RWAVTAPARLTCDALPNLAVFDQAAPLRGAGPASAPPLSLGGPRGARRAPAVAKPLLSQLSRHAVAACMGRLPHCPSSVSRVSGRLLGTDLRRGEGLDGAPVPSVEERVVVGGPGLADPGRAQVPVRADL